ncbi:hypothetical protein HK096_003975 [Nowakowskiella sp. JEL0078]|nr:hypothetical protein HK096_003975 [Nowakowskiella sp. JEL0078]
MIGIQFSTCGLVPVKEAKITEKTATDPRTYEPEFEFFVNQRVFDLRVSYSYPALIFHIFICYYITANLFWCPEKSISAIQTKLTNSTIIQLTHHHNWAWNLSPNEFKSCLYPQTFVQFSWYIQSAFYLGLLIARYLKPSLEQNMLIFMPYMINGCIWSSVYLLARSQKPTSLFFSRTLNKLDQSDVFVQNPAITYNWSHLRHGTMWNIWFPVVVWWLFLLARRGAMGLYMWEYETSVHNSIIQFLEGLKRKEGETDEQLEDRKIGHARMRLRTFRIFCLLSPCVILAVWDLVIRQGATGLRWFSEFYQSKDKDFCFSKQTDMAKFPGLMWSVFLCVVAGAPMVIWYSFITFQIQVVTWTERWKRGFAILAWENETKVGVIF